jgi:hypothetical protein
MTDNFPTEIDFTENFAETIIEGPDAIEIIETKTGKVLKRIPKKRDTKSDSESKGKTGKTVKN